MTDEREAWWTERERVLKDAKRRVEERLSSVESELARLRTERAKPTPGILPLNADGDLVCSFCWKPRSEVTHLIAGPNVLICNECVALSAEIIAGDALRTSKARLAPGETCSACGHHEMTDEEVKAEVERLRDRAERVNSARERRLEGAQGEPYCCSLFELGGGHDPMCRKAQAPDDSGHPCVYIRQGIECPSGCKSAPNARAARCGYANVAGNWCRFNAGHDGECECIQGLNVPGTEKP